MPSQAEHPDFSDGHAIAWLRTVILRHHVPPRATVGARTVAAADPGSSTDHYDWLIETPSPPGVTPTDDDRTLICFRCAERPDELIARREPFTTQRLSDHRRRYLWFEGELSGGRGRVTRVAQGRSCLVACAPSSIRIDIEFGGSRHRVVMTPEPGGAACWRCETFDVHGAKQVSG